MAFDFSKAKINAKRDMDNKTVGAIILGAPGAGKSTFCGTFPGTTLYLYSGGESHGPSAASTNSGEALVAVRMDRDDDGNALSADASYQRLIDVLGSPESIVSEGITAVVLDSLTEIESIIRSTTKWSRACESANGKHNSFSEGSSTIEMFRPILVALRELALDHGIHYAATCPLTVQELGEDGQIIVAAPRLSGYSVAENLIMQFPDVLVVGRVEKAGKQVYALQFAAGVTKVSKDQAGTIKKLANFNPRITGVKTLPELMPANFSKVIELKAKG